MRLHEAHEHPLARCAPPADVLIAVMITASSTWRTTTTWRMAAAAGPLAAGSPSASRRPLDCRTPLLNRRACATKHPDQHRALEGVQPLDLEGVQPLDHANWATRRCALHAGWGLGCGCERLGVVMHGGWVVEGHGSCGWGWKVGRLLGWPWAD